MNYFIMLDTVLWNLNFKNENLWIQDLPLRILDGEGNIVASVTFKQSIFTSFTELSLNYTQNNPQFESFKMGFKCNYIDIRMEFK